MDNLMIPVVPAKEPGVKLDPKAMGRPDDKSSFSRYLERKMVTDRQERKNFLGAGTKRAEKVTANARQPEQKSIGGKEESAGLPALLAQFLAEIRAQAESMDAGPGSWSFTLPDPSQLTKLAEAAGMNEAQIAQLLQQFDANKGTFEVDQFLAMLARHFEGLQNEQPVTVPETELPLLEILLSRMGVPSETVQEIGARSITGDNQLDLARLLDAMKNTPPGQPTVLTDWEAEQLQNILAEAGVSKSMQRELLPELHAPWENPNQPPRPVALSMERLQNMLAQGLRDIADQQVKPDIAKFVEDLKAIFAEADFADKTVGWSPAVQKAADDAYKALLENVDLATVQMKKLQPGARTAPEAKNADSGDLTEEMLADAAADEAIADPIVFAKPEKDGVPASLPKKSNGNLPPDDALARQKAPEAMPQARHEAVLAGSSETAQAEQRGGAPEARPSPQVPRLPPILQQQTFERISETVIRGLRNNEHHLVLRLYPKELGEVKVEMMVRDDHVAVSFAMENTRVKEVLENNMDMFRHNLEKQGFTLEECMVSLNRQHDEGSESWREFVQDWHQRRGEGSRVNPAEIPDDALYVRPSVLNGREQGIDLIA